MSWFLLFLAGAFEVVWAVGLKMVDSTGRSWVLVATCAAVVVSLVLLSYSMRSIPIGTAYAVWTGIGTIGTFLVGVLWFEDPVSLARIASVSLIVAGIVGLKYLT